MKDAATEREKLRIMAHWLDDVCAELGVDRALVERLTGPALGMISDVAHGPSRPGAPMTALVVGLATQPGDSEQQITERIARVIAMTASWEAPTAQDEAGNDVEGTAAGTAGTPA